MFFRRKNRPIAMASAIAAITTIRRIFSCRKPFFPSFVEVDRL